MEPVVSKIGTRYRSAYLKFPGWWVSSLGHPLVFPTWSPSGVYKLIMIKTHRSVGRKTNREVNTVQKYLPENDNSGPSQEAESHH